ncbi:unannotated protein [freshwater metagenome]|uniref:Unannotated protein n=1 Tax=freshwater metagenome TaxID=449393 RepID=A0A6J7GZ85_9ZZZZ
MRTVGLVALGALREVIDDVLRLVRVVRGRRG